MESGTVPLIEETVVKLGWVLRLESKPFPFHLVVLSEALRMKQSGGFGLVLRSRSIFTQKVSKKFL